MSEIVLRPIVEEEFPAVHWVGCVAFGEDARNEEIPFARRGFNLERSMCAFDDGRVVGSSSVHTMQLTVPGGGAVPAGGLTWIAVLPTHRRRGLLRRMVTAQFEQMRARGEVVSVLLASEGTIYERFGYGPATFVAGLSIDRTTARLRHYERCGGRMVMLEPAAASAELPSLFEQFRHLRPGEVSRPAGWWEEYLFDPEHHREGGGGMFHAKHLDESGVPDGYVSYRIKEGWDNGMPVGELNVVEMVAAHEGALIAIWEYLLKTDLVTKVSFTRGRVDEPLRWALVDPRGVRVSGVTDYLWVRILDVPRALSARRYETSGTVVLEVVDSFPSREARVYSLSVSSAGNLGRCEETDAAPQLRIQMGDLGAVFLGGVSIVSLSAAGRITELLEGAVAQADAMFRTAPAPYCCTLF